MNYNYVDTFIQIAPDCTLTLAVVPPLRAGRKSIAILEYEMISAAPYVFTQEQVLFTVHARHKGITEQELATCRHELWSEFFSRPHACMRASPLPKAYGWGLHFDADGKVALCAVESPAYRRFADDRTLTRTFAMRSKRP